MPSPPDSPLEEVFLNQWLLHHPEHPPERQYVIPIFEVWRKAQRLGGSPMNVDYAWPAAAVAVEIQGGTWSRGRSGHSSGAGIRRDCTKAALAQFSGWVLIAIEHKMLVNEEAIWMPQLAGLIAHRLAHPPVPPSLPTEPWAKPRSSKRRARKRKPSPRAASKTISAKRSTA